MLSPSSSPLRRALWLCWLALPLVLLPYHIAAAQSMPFSRYQSQVREAVDKLKTLEQSAKTDSPAEHAARVAATLNDVRNLVPVDEEVSVEGETVRVNNNWLREELQAYEKMSPNDPHRAEALARMTERLSALAERLEELEWESKSAGERAQSGIPRGDAKKAQEKARLEEMLRREPFAEKPPYENPLVSLWKRFLAWLRKLFPGSSGLEPGQMSWASIIALIVIIALVVAVLAYAVWKLLPFFHRRRTQLKLGRREARVVLGERLAPDQSGADLMKEAEALARRGELRAAIRKAYIAVLCELGDRKVIALSQHKTNRDYLRALRERRNLLGEMQKLTSSFENHWYGFQQATADDWTSFRAGYQKVMSDV